MKPPPWNLDGRAGPGREMLIEVISPHAQAMLHMPRVPGAVAHRRRGAAPRSDRPHGPAVTATRDLKAPDEAAAVNQLKLPGGLGGARAEPIDGLGHFLGSDQGRQARG